MKNVCTVSYFVFVFCFIILNTSGCQPSSEEVVRSNLKYNYKQLYTSNQCPHLLSFSITNPQMSSKEGMPTDAIRASDTFDRSEYYYLDDSLFIDFGKSDFFGHSFRIVCYDGNATILYNEGELSPKVFGTPPDIYQRIDTFSLSLDTTTTSRDQIIYVQLHFLYHLDVILYGHNTINYYTFDQCVKLEPLTSSGL